VTDGDHRTPRAGREPADPTSELLVAVEIELSDPACPPLVSVDAIAAALRANNHGPSPTEVAAAVLDDLTTWTVASPFVARRSRSGWLVGLGRRVAPRHQQLALMTPYERPEVRASLELPRPRRDGPPPSSGPTVRAPARTHPTRYVGSPGAAPGGDDQRAARLDAAHEEK
jgi:hypothetical protein